MTTIVSVAIGFGFLVVICVLAEYQNRLQRSLEMLDSRMQRTNEYLEKIHGILNYEHGESCKKRAEEQNRQFWANETAKISGLMRAEKDDKVRCD